MCLVLLASCQSRQEHNSDEDKASEASIDYPQDLPADFKIFYDRFHSDEDYQMTHILWPLRGLPDQVDSLTLANDNYRFEKDNWVMHRHMQDPDHDFEQYFAVVDDKLIIDRIETSVMQMRMERRFAKLDTSWYLIYYMGMNRIN